MEKYIKIFIPEIIWNKIDKNPELKKILANLNWLFLDKAIQLVIAFFVGIWVIRYLGPERYGMLSYAVAFVSLFGFIASMGINGIAVREFVKNKNREDELFGTLFFLKLTAGFLAFISSWVVIFFVKPGNSLIFWLAFIIALGFIFKVSDIFDFWFQSKVISKYTVYVKSSISIIIGAIKVVLILERASLIAFAWVILLESVVTLIGFIYIYIKKKGNLTILKISVPIGKKILSDSWPLMLSSIAVTVYMKIDQVMIGNMLGNKSLGIYSAAVSLSEVWFFIPIIITTSVFPAIIYAKKKSIDIYKNRWQSLYDIMVWLSIIIILPISLFSKDIVNILFGIKYVQSSSVLSIYIWSSILVFSGVVGEKFLVAENIAKISLLKNIMGGIINIILNLWLIPKYGIIGAAWATVISYMVSFAGLVIWKRTRINIKLFLNAFNLIRIYKDNKKLII